VPAAQRIVYIVPHTHWDREWYETFATFRAQLVELWDQLLTLTETEPDFRFLMDGQSVVIDDYLEIRPEARDRLERAVGSGRIQVGPWYTLPDEFLVSGETLVRNLQKGLAIAGSHGGSMRVGYLPDSFGHAAQMPQIYRQFGFRHAAVWRGVPLSIDRVAFIWEAPDRSEVLTAYMGNSYSHGVDLPTDAKALAARIAAALKAIEPFKPGGQVLLMNGNDHVLPQAALSQAVRQASGMLDGTTIRLARLDEYLDVLPEQPWPRWRGELRSSARANVLMGTLSVRVADKQEYARATRTLERLAEPLVALSGAPYAAELDAAWTLILQNAAHDTACGSGIDAVAEQARGRSVQALAISRELIDQAIPLLAADDHVWNPSPFPRQDIVDVDGKPVLTSVIPGFAARPIEPVTPRAAVTTSDRHLENEWLAVELTASGTLDIRDKRQGISYQGLHRFVDEGDAGDEYNFSPPPEATAVLPSLQGFESRATEPGPVRGRIAARFRIPIVSGLSHDRRRRGTAEVALPARLQLSLSAAAPRLDFHLEVENLATDHRLRLHFPLPFAPVESAADTPYHVTRRAVLEPKRDPGSPELELPSYPMRSFVDVSDGQAGVALITDGLHEYEVLPPPGNELALTLLRAVGWLSREDLGTRTGHAGPAIETPGAQQAGSHRFRYSLYFHAGDWEQGGVWRAAECALLFLFRGRGKGQIQARPSIQIDPDSVQLTACVPRPDGYDLRLLNAADRGAQAALRISPAPSSVSRLDLGGELRGSLPTGSGGLLELPMGSWEIATLRVAR
jgi:alpha-mannosidase